MSALSPNAGQAVVESISGADLLSQARSLEPTELAALAGPGASPAGDSLIRPALVATLLTQSKDADREFIRTLTSFEIAAVRKRSHGSGDVLPACCWLLFMIGDVEDSALIREAKELNFDTFNYIDSVFLVPRGIEATRAFALHADHAGLAEYISKGWPQDPMDVAEDWRSGRYWGSIPDAGQTVETLASWIAN